MIPVISKFGTKLYYRAEWTACFFLLCCPAISFSQQGEVSVESRIDKAEVSVGELVLYIVPTQVGPRFFPGFLRGFSYIYIPGDAPLAPVRRFAGAGRSFLDYVPLVVKVFGQQVGAAHGYPSLFPGQSNAW